MKHLFLPAACLFLSLFVHAQKTIRTQGTELLIPEGITVHPVSGKIFVSSIAAKKIIAIDSAGNHTDFVGSGKNGLLEALGMKIDSRGWLWVASNKKEGKKHTSRIHAFNNRGKVEQSYTLTDTSAHLFNDLAISSSGQVYITDMFGHRIYHVDPQTKKLDVFIGDSIVLWPNGLTFGSDDSILYVATYARGLLKVDMSTRNVAPLTGWKDTAYSHGMDGLVFYNNSLIGVFNGEQHAHSVVRYSLNETGETITGEAIVDSAHADFGVPTTAALHHNQLFVLANSHLDLYNTNKSSVKGIESKLKPVAVVRYDLE
jgi:sugar lactone lactonase YvrE